MPQPPLNPGFSPIQQKPEVSKNKPKQQKSVLSKHKSDKNNGKFNKYKNSKTIKIFSTNAAGVVTGKLDSLVAEVSATNANIVTVQETHSNRKGKVVMPTHFVVFEAIRPAKNGGTLCAVHEDLNPKLIEEYNNPFEMLVVQIEVQNKSIRVITGVGPQENWDEDKRTPFFIALEAEVVKAHMSGHSVIIEIDSNSKLGNQYIPSDPHHISPNGKMLARVIDNHALIVANSLSKCTGLITRRRITKYRTEESCIDMLLFSSDLQQYFTSLLIDEKRKHVLTKIRNTKNGVIKKESDHHVLLSEFKDISFTTNKTNYNIYNLKNIVCQERFKEYTSQTKMLSSIFDSSDDINILAKRFLKKLDGCIAINFKKIRVSHTKESDEDKLYKKMRELKDKEDNKSKTELDNIIKNIANLSEEKYQKVMEDLNSMKPSEGKIDSQKFWKIKRKMCKKSIDPPAAMFDSDGTLLTSNYDIQARALEIYTDRLKGNKIEKRLEDYEKEINELCKSRLKLCKLNKAKAWTMEDLDMAIKDLDRGKSRDALGYANEIIKDEVAGTDLKLATLRFMNHIRKEQKFPDCLQACNITSLYKNKGSRKDLMNYRGVFRVPLFRSILDRLMYNDLYTILDSNLTDGNVGARKGRNIRDNIFILGAVINSVTNGGEEPVQIQVVDVEKCFDKLWLEATTNALYEAGIRSDLLNLLYIENQTAKIAVKVNGQLTKRVNVKNVEIQGSVWGSMKCTNTMDQLNKILLKQDHLTYHYKGDENIKI